MPTPIKNPLGAAGGLTSTCKSASAPNKSECALAGEHVGKEFTVTGQHFTSTALEAEPLTLSITTLEPRVDSRTLARNMGVKSRASFALIERYADTLKAHGQLTFKKAVGERQQGGGNAERYAMLNENQSFFLLTL